ncbi:hypothetical protein [Alicyclobacillus sp. SO9]|uniref:hypothetical protein n=1 Tax=Alicyclobacillus sp. SO9 TaxID=2665646 RepID=UPI0018E852F7|nr:hypothetical protein [Alicyclobacillus sp. SO9]QQE79137.1 hypothetical protein GI364_01045 [Alicyclobacillus sp. SO9]
MKPFLVGILFLIIFSIEGVVTGHWTGPMHWMLITGGIASFISAMFTGAPGLLGRKMPTVPEGGKWIRKVSFPLLLFGLPNLIVGVALWFITLPPGP